MATIGNAINANTVGIVGFSGTAFTGTAVTQHSILIGGSSSDVITNLGVATNGQLPIGSTGADPVLATITAGSGISVSNGAGTITISATSALLGWTVVTATSQSAAINNGYITNNAALVTVTLPATAAVGSIVRVDGLGAGGWLVAQNAGQQINVGSVQSTSGTGGSVASTNQYDAIELLCVVANNTWTTLSSVGNLSVT